MQFTIPRHPVVRAIIALAAFASVSACVAQTPAPSGPGTEVIAPRPPLPERPPAGPEADAQREQVQLDGRIASFVINPEGSVDGLMLKDSTLVRFPPHMGSKIVASFPVGAPVRLMGMRSANGDMRAVQLSSPDGGVRLVDQPPSPNGPPSVPAPLEPRSAGLVKLKVSGEIARLTTAPHGEPDGVMLRDGTVIKLTPSGAQQFTDLLRPGTIVEAQGYGSQNQYGRALQATAFGTSGKVRQLHNQQPN